MLFQLPIYNMRVHRLHKALSFLMIIYCLSRSITEALRSHKKNDLIMRNVNESSVLLPPEFLFGTASSAYQFEGAYLTDGKGLNNWDLFTHEPGNILDRSNGDIAVDQYHRYKEDINLMSSLGVNSYRFSISWARILPKGRYGDVNMKGIKYYNKLIDALLLKEIKPFVTLSHYDIPQELEERYRSWLSPLSQRDFAYYADICFKFFGDRVKHWVTFNEPNIEAIVSYRLGVSPPSRCSKPFGNCTEGDSETEPFVVSYNMIMSHARAVEIYRNYYQKHQGGVIGIVLQAIWFEPMSDSIEDKLAVERAMSYYLNWFLDPIIYGKYPAEMEEILGSALPKFSASDKDKLKMGLDFIGINQYTASYVQDCIYTYCGPGSGGSKTEGFFSKSSEKNGVRIGEFREPCMVEWQNVYPQGMEKTVTYIAKRYKNIPIYITENGYGCFENPTEGLVLDVGRINFLAGYSDALLTAMRQGADVRGYFVWSLLDNFEWKYGYTLRFGIYHVDFATQKRSKKLSATWFEEFIAKHKAISSLQITTTTL